MSHRKPGFEDAVHTKLWKLCAGPLVYFPTLGEKVLYFPQGHMEYLAALANEDVNQQFPCWDNLPSQILCRVANIQLLVEQETDEPYARITLDPISDETESTSPNPNLDACVLEHTSSFIKVLTASDVNTHGGCTVRRKDATACFPPLAEFLNSTQELVAKDLHGFDYPFTHVFRGTPLRHLLTTGWNNFVSSKRLMADDAIIFVRGGNGKLGVGFRREAHRPTYVPSIGISSQSMGGNGKLGVGFRREAHRPMYAPSIGISSQNMYFGVLAAASLALKTSSLLVVIYKPRINKLRTSEFIVSLNKYVKAINNKFSFGMHFGMPILKEYLQSQEEKFTTGVIVGVCNLSLQWPESKWRSLQIQWDEHATLPRPERISPWEIEPLKDYVKSCPVCNKKPKAHNNKPKAHNNLNEQLETAQNAESLNFRLFGFEVPNSIAADPLKEL